jgi:hypothetical protein
VDVAAEADKPRVDLDYRLMRAQRAPIKETAEAIKSNTLASVKCLHLYSAFAIYFVSDLF